MTGPALDDVTTVGLVMAGGAGTRLYPASRSDRPKQFQSFGSDRSLLRQAVDRLDFLEEVYVVTRPEYAETVEEIAPDTTVLTEPEPKDTGPALVYATHTIARAESDPVVLCTPSDHVIGEGFATDATEALEAAAETEGLVTIGIEPTRPATEYGYILPGKPRDGYAPVDDFHEKPGPENAEVLLERGATWNAGIFAWRPKSFLDAARLSPLEPLVEALEAGEAEQGFEAVSPVSVDYAILEEASNAFVVPGTFPWDDLGSWDALDRLLEGENAVIGDALAIDAEDNVISSDDKHVSVLGVDDLVVVAYDDRVLVVPKERAQAVRSVVSRLKEDGLF